MQPYVDKLKAQYDKVIAELSDKKADLEIANQDGVGELEKKLKEIKGKLEELQDAGEDKIEGLKNYVDKLMNDIETSWNKLLEKLKA